MATANPTFERLLERGEPIESISEMTPGYLQELKHTLLVSGDTELISAPAYYLATQRAPSVNAFMTGMAIIQDELAHAHIAYHLLEELGEDQEQLIFSRDPRSFRYPYAFDVPLTSWTELIVANLFYDQAGFCLLGDIHERCSYGPWKRGLNKVMLEENFHLRNGRTWARRMAQAGGETKAELQRAVDWMFPLTVEWFGLPDHIKTHSTQLDYRLKGKTNDQLRQWWLSLVVPYCEEIGIRVPAHREVHDGAETWVLEYPFPCTFDPEAKRWDFSDPCSWDDVLRRWRARGPRNAEMVAALQEEFHRFRRAHPEAAAGA
ncbi:MAG TPA: Phenylacetic acid catabolic protein [Candidatus Dormibacteraeota bacterium]|nr:Phenylacetic acid catabolic protein [Candidatus Dormibacteraeota bacterium]